MELPAHVEPARAVFVRSPDNEVAIVRSGWATVRMEAGKLTVINHDANVLTGTPQRVQALTKRHGRSGSCRLGNGSRPLPRVAHIRPGDRVLFSIGKPVAPRGFSWIASTNAVRYRVRFINVATKHEAATFETERTSLGSDAPLLEQGSYDAIVEPIDACGLEGPATVERLRVVGLELPPGSFVDDQGRLRLQDEQRVGITNTEGLLMRSPGASTWYRAPEVLTFRGEGDRRVLLAVSRTGVSTELHMAPRDFAAEVKMAPTNVRWPEQPVTVTIQVVNRAGGPAPGWLHPIAHVTLGTRPLPVEWKQDGALLRTEIPPQPGSGPCVLRVEVTDQYGLTLGRSFLEVERS
jgi:hypothetical protein